MAKLIIYPTPLNAFCQLQHDSGYSVDGVASVDSNNRPCQVFEIKSDTPNGWGARLVISSPSKVTLMQRGILYGESERWLFYADDFTLVDEKICPEPIPVPPNPNPDPMPSDPAGIINWTYKQKYYDLSAKAGCGEFTEDCCTNLHEHHSIQWGHIRKTGAQNQYNGHAVDAVQLLNPKNGTAQGIYDIIISSESHDAKPAFNFSGPPDPNLWYYPAAK